MKGLILKDLYTMRSSYRILMAMLLFFVVIGLLSENPSFFASFVGVLCIMTPISSFSYDQYCGWDQYGASMPLGRRAMVKAKYLLALMMSLLGIVISGVLQLILMLLGNREMAGGILPGALAAGGSCLMIVLFLLPTIYRFGVEKGRLMMMALGIGVMLLIFGISKIEHFITAKGVATALFSLPVILIVLFWLSYRLSCRFFEAKEL